jgi:hypothetical protein
MTREELGRRLRDALIDHANRLSYFEDTLWMAVEGKQPMPLSTDVFAALSNAADETRGLINLYRNQPIPSDISEAVLQAQVSIKNLGAALMLSVFFGRH